jgi:hypothetical protein
MVAGAGEHFGAGHDIGTTEMREEEEADPCDRSPMGTLRYMNRGLLVYACPVA